MRGYVLVGAVFAVAACGGDKKPVKKPKPKPEPVVEAPETEEDREDKRRAQRRQIVPDGSTCLPPALKEEGAPRLELGAAGADAVVCAIDQDKERLLGPVGCWKIDLQTGGLTYKGTDPLPGRGFTVKIDDNCARGYCVPKEAKVSGDTANIAWDLEGKRVAVLVGEDVHLFDAESKKHESSFSVRGDKGVTNKPAAVHLIGSHVIVEGSDEGYAAVWVFKADGTAVGSVNALGGKEEKPISIYKGSLSILDKERIAVAERGMEVMTTYDLEGGKRARLVRGGKKPACKPAELDAFWHDAEGVGDKCKGSIEALSGHLMGATAVAGAKNFLVLLRGERLGELGVLESKSLSEKKAIKMPWCEASNGGGAAAATDEADEGGEESAPAKKTAPAATRGAKPKESKSSDPEEGGE